MGNLAHHILKVVRLRHPSPIIPVNVRPVFARMDLLAGQLAEDAATAIDHRDALSGDRLAEADDAVAIARQACYLATGRMLVGR